MKKVINPFEHMTIEQLKAWNRIDVESRNLKERHEKLKREYAEEETKENEPKRGKEVEGR